MEPIDVVLIEDNEIFREALEMLLGVTPGMRVVASVPDGRTALAVCRTLRPAVALLDYRLPDMDGVQATTALRASCPTMSIVVLTANVERQEFEALREAGAVACLTKDRDLTEIVAAIRRAAGSS